MRSLQAFQRLSSALGAAAPTTMAAALLGAGGCRLRSLSTSLSAQQGKVPGFGPWRRGAAAPRLVQAICGRRGLGWGGPTQGAACGWRRAARGRQALPAQICGPRNQPAPAAPCLQPEAAMPDALDQEFDRGEE